MKFLAAFFLILFPLEVFALACCAGGSSKSFVSVKNLQKYELGVATSFRDVYGFYNRYGELEPFAKNQTGVLSLGLAARFVEGLQGSFVIPFVYRYFGSGASNRSATALGDLLIGAQYTLVDPVFRDDWYPTISVLTFLKFPTGTTDRRDRGSEVPGTGNGQWEPSIAIQFEKPIGILSATLRAGYNWRIGQPNMSDGNVVELMESLTLPIGNRFSFSGGATQNWYSNGGRVASVFFTPTYFASQDISLSAGVDFTVPIHGWGKSQPATQLLSFALRYALF